MYVGIPTGAFYISDILSSHLEAMAALEAATAGKLQDMSEARALKQSMKLRLQADPTISVSALHSTIAGFLRHKGTKDLWTLLAPPPTGPLQYGWHTHPQADWLMKVLGLLFDLIGLAPNTKLHSAKVVKCLKSMAEAKELDLHVNKNKNADACIDELDLTLRILLNMVRTLKCNSHHQQRIRRSLCKAEQVKMDLVLARVQLPQELLSNGSCGSFDGWDDETSGPSVTVPPQQLERQETETAIVPYVEPKPTPVKEPVKQYLGRAVLPPLPSIFSKILGRSTPVSSAPKPVSKPSPLPTSPVLEQAMNHVPATVLREPKKGKKDNKNKKDVMKKKKCPMKKSKTSSKKPQNHGPREDHHAKYEPGKFREAQQLHVQRFLEEAARNGEQVTQRIVLKSWSTSAKRAAFLANLSLSELKRRRFVGKDALRNPFADIVSSVPHVD